MLEAIIKFAADKFHLGDKANGLVSLLLHDIFDTKQGGVQGYIDRFTDAGFGDIVQSWIGGGPGAKEIQPDQVVSALGMDTITRYAGKLGLPNASITNSLAGVLPLLFGKLTSGGKIPASLPAGLSSYLTGNIGHGAARVVADTSTGAGLGWLKWLIPLALLGLLGYCALNRKPAEVTAPVVEETAPAVDTTVPDVVEPAAPAADAVAPAIAAANVYFDVDKADLPADTDSSLAEVVAYLQANAGARASISGYHSPEGDAVHNEELSKNRAMAVRDNLVAAGIGEDRLDLDKPIVTTGGGVERESRRVEVRIK